MLRVSPLFAVLTLWAFAAQLPAAHVTDKLVIGIYAEPKVEGSPLKLLSSGTPLEVVARKDNFAQVRLADKTEGWVEAAYVTDEKPAKAVLLETQARLRQLKQELDTLKAARADATVEADAATPRLTPSAREARLQRSLEQAQARLEQFEQAQGEQATAPARAEQLEQLQARVRQAVELLGGGAGEQGGEASAARSGIVARYRHWIIALIAVVIGFGAGVAFIDYRLRKRHGGFRI